MSTRYSYLDTPREHGMVALGPFSVIFMSYIPGITLAEARPTPSHNEKLSIQRRLEDIFDRLLHLPIDSQGIGGMRGGDPKSIESMKSHYSKTSNLLSNLATCNFQPIITAAIRMWACSLLQNADPLMLRQVFTQGDLRTASISRGRS